MADQKYATNDTFSTHTHSSHTLPAPAHTLSSEAVVRHFNSDAIRGLSHDEAASLLAAHGPNRLSPPKRPSLLKVCGRQIVNAMTLVLIAATAVSLGTRDYISGGVIAALIMMNVGVGTYTEWQAEKTVASLESVGSPTANVVRHKGGEKANDGIMQGIDVESVVPGDIIALENGDIVPADARILDGHLSALESDEALLTGESLPVRKRVEPIEEADCPVGDRKNMVFSGSQITKGRARAVVTATGMSTELGAIAAALQRQAKSQETGRAARWHQVKSALGLADTTPLQLKLNRLAYILLGLACLTAFIVVASTAFSNVPLSVATYAVAAAVSLLPASLVAVVSLTLATASTALARRKALVRRMDAVESLAQVTDVCSDKTGTLTVGKMVLKKLWVPTTDEEESRGQQYSVESGSDPYYPRGAVLPIASNEKAGQSLEDGTAIDIHNLDAKLHNLALCASLANMATVSRSTEDESWSASGDATEIALQVLAHKLGMGKPNLTRPPRQLKPIASRNSAQPPAVHTQGHYELLVEHSFDSTVKRMSTAWRYVPEDPAETQSALVFMKGAVERVLERCVTIGLHDDGPALDDAAKDTIIDTMDALASEGLRVLALCGRTENADKVDQMASRSRDELERDFGFLGLVGIYDPPRPESRGAVAECKLAGIVPRMLTGDHSATAVAIAEQIGILERSAPSAAVMTGQQFDALSDEQIDALPQLPVVIARCAPQTKVRMVEALHRRHRATIMTGDGVNDAPALKRADIGIAMGLNGSDVAKQSAEIVLADDNFSTIIRAIRKGRSVFGNLAKFLLFLLSGNVAEVVVLLIGLAFKDENGISVFPLSPVAALWINTLTAGPPAFALGLEPTAKDAMEKSPGAYKTIFTLEWYLDLFFYGFLMGALSLINFVIVVYGRYNGELGIDCNEGYNTSCDVVFIARATCFATLVIVLLLHTITCKNLDQSIFRMNLLDNKLLLYIIIILALTVFPAVYIPTINTDVFLLSSLTWEWAIVAGSALVYLATSELWKLWRRSRRPRRSVSESKTLRLADTMDVRMA